jgi:hypothetical protein
MRRSSGGEKLSANSVARPSYGRVAVVCGGVKSALLATSLLLLAILAGVPASSWAVGMNSVSPGKLVEKGFC